jgi:CBS domain-containing protein
MTDLTTLVSDADTLIHLVPPIVLRDDPLPHIILSAASDPAARAAFVVDGDGRLVGVAPVSELDRDMLVLVVPGVFTGERMSGRQLARLSHGTSVTASQLMRDAATIALTDTLATALKRMEEHGLESAVVLDDERRPLGYVAMFEILAELLIGPGATIPS